MQFNVKRLPTVCPHFADVSIIYFRVTFMVLYYSLVAHVSFNHGWIWN